MVDMRYNSQCILVFSSTTIIPKKTGYARFCVIETVFLNYLFVTASFIYTKYQIISLHKLELANKNRQLILQLYPLFLLMIA